MKNKRSVFAANSLPRTAQPMKKQLQVIAAAIKAKGSSVNGYMCETTIESPDIPPVTSSKGSMKRAVAADISTVPRATSRKEINPRRPPSPSILCGSFIHFFSFGSKVKNILEKTAFPVELFPKLW